MTERTQHRRSEPRSPFVAHVPRLAAEWDLDHAGQRWFPLEATSLFVDVTGFTTISERLARLGAIGAEQLTDLLDHVFSRLLAAAYEKGGTLLKFGGDALLLAFTREEHTRLGLEAAVAMRRALSGASATTAVGKVQLRASMGLHTGTLYVFRAGSTSHELIVGGPDCSTTLLLERIANTGEILVSEAAAERLPARALERSDHGLRARAIKVVEGGPGLVPRREVPNAAIEAWIPSRLRARLDERAGEAEHRTCSLAFVRFSGTDGLLDAVGGNETSRAVDAVVNGIQQVAGEHDVTVLASDTDVDGGKLILATGVPTSAEDDEGRILRAARAIADVHGPLQLHVGVDRGAVFVGDVGPAYRRTFTLIGDTVNVAARLASAAPSGVVFASSTVLQRSRTEFDALELGPLSIKGRREDVTTWSVGSPLGVRHREIGGLPFLGRDAELAELVERFAQLDGGGGGDVLIEGDRGSGKTRIVNEFVAQIPPERVLRVQGESFASGVPYHPFRTLAREVLGVVSEDADAAGLELRTSMERLVPELVPMAPLLAPLADAALEPTPETDALASRFVPARTADVLVQVLEACRPGPLLLLAEDAHWFDGASSELAAALAIASRTRPWLCCVTRRPTLAGYAPSEPTTRIRLEPLDDTVIAALIDEGTASKPLRPEQQSAMVAKADGNPLFVEELLRVIAEGMTETIPDSLDAIAMSEIDALPSDGRRLVLAASVLGLRADISLLEALVGVGQLDAGRGAWSDLLGDDGEGHLQFRHALLQESAYASLPYRVRRDLHRKAGLAIEAARGRYPDAPAMLSLHFAEAQDWERTWRYARVAADGARAAHAPGEVLTHLGRATTAGRQLASVRPGLVASLLEDAAEAAILLGDYERADATLREAARTWQFDPLACARIAERRAYLRSEYQGRLAAAIRQVHHGVRLLDGPVRQRAGATRLLGALLAREADVRTRQGRFSDAVILAREAAGAAERTGDDRTLALALALQDQALAESGRVDEAVHLPRALELYERLGALDSAAMMLGNLGSVAYWRWDWVAAADAYARSAEAATVAGDLATAAVAQVNLGELRVDQRRDDDAIALLRPAVRTLAAFGYVLAMATARMHLGRALIRRGEPQEGLELIREALEQFDESGLGMAALDARAKLAEAFATAGDLAPARDALADARRAERALDTSAFGTLLDRIQSTIAVVEDAPDAPALVAGAVQRARDAGASYDLCLLLGLSDAIGQGGGAEAATLAHQLGVVTS